MCEESDLSRLFLDLGIGRYLRELECMKVMPRVI
jgi:hypothetical protein